MTMSPFMQAAFAEAQASFDEGGLPVGAVLVRDEKVVSSGRNRQEQTGSNLLHAETDAIERAGRLGRAFFRECTLYTTLAPCAMCSGTALFYEIPRLVIGDATNYSGEVAWLRERGITVEIEESAECVALLQRFMAENPAAWRKATVA